jgi:hypothetical protein
MSSERGQAMMLIEHYEDHQHDSLNNLPQLAYLMLGTACSLCFCVAK